MTLVELVTIVCSSAFAAGGAYAAVRTRLHYMEKSITRIETRTEYAHQRIDTILES